MCVTEAQANPTQIRQEEQHRSLPQSRAAVDRPCLYPQPEPSVSSRSGGQDETMVAQGWSQGHS